MSKLVVTLPLPEIVLDPLRAAFEVVAWDSQQPIDRPTLLSWIADADAVLCSLTTKLDREVLAAAPALQLISSVSVGVDHIDLAAASAQGIAVGNTPGVLVDSTADLTLALMLDITRRLSESDRMVRAGGWNAPWSTGFLLGTDLSKATVGLIGLGEIGQAVARRLQGFGSRVIGWNRTPRDIEGVENVVLDELFATADIVSLHTALTPDTKGFVSAERLASMKDGATLINTGRGALVDEDALATELKSGRLRAGLDVYVQEPLPANSPLMDNIDNVVLCPHLGSATGATRQAMLMRALENLKAGMSGQRVPYCANPEVYD